MKRYKLGQRIPEGYEYDNRGLKYGDRVVLVEPYKLDKVSNVIQFPKRYQ